MAVSGLVVLKDDSLLSNWNVTCLAGVVFGFDFPIIGTTAEVAIGDVLTLVVDVEELRLTVFGDNVGEVASSACMTTSGFILLVALPDIASNMLFSLVFILVWRMLTISDFFISSVSSVVNLGLILPCSSIKVFSLSIFCGSAFMNSLSVSFTGTCCFNERASLEMVTSRSSPRRSLS